jgi:hypothetical protein
MSHDKAIAALDIKSESAYDTASFGADFHEIEGNNVGRANSFFLACSAGEIPWCALNGKFRANP